MKTIFITAGTGYIGKRLTKQLLQRGHRVIAMVRMPAVKVKDSLRVTLKNWRESLFDDKADNLMAIAEGDYVAVSGDWSATFKTDFMGMKTAGKKVKIKEVDFSNLTAMV
ncbi:MAG: ester cyclase [Chitinophagaceae bacterium]